MLYYTASLLIAAMIVLTASRSRVNGWAAFFLMAAASGGLTEWLMSHDYESLAALVVHLNQILTPFGVFMFAIVYCYPVISNKKMLVFATVLFLPVLLSFSFRLVGLSNDILTIVISVWAVLYYLLSCVLLITSVVREHNDFLKKQRMITALIMVPALLAVAVLVHIVYTINPQFEFFGWVAIFIGVSFGIALLGAFVYGVLGVKLKIERDPMQSAIDTASQGASLLRHSVKNEAAKILLSIDNLKYEQPSITPEALQHLVIIEQAAQRLHRLTDKIHEKTKEWKLDMELFALDQLLDEIIVEFSPVWEKADIILDHKDKVIVQRVMVVGDRLHLREVICNILINAAEALKGQLDKRLALGLTTNKKYAMLIIADNGCGIEASDMERIIEPFYSTKQTNNNYGLGLSYSHRIVRQSGGKLVWQSRAGEGTSFQISLPLAKQGGEDDEK